MTTNSGGQRTALPRDARTETPLVRAIERIVVSGLSITSTAIADAAASEELTLGQWRALAIVHASDRLRVGELALRLAITVPSASRLVRRLEDRGLVAPQRDEQDRRATLIAMTPRGDAVFEAVTGRRRALIADAVSAQATDAEFEIEIEALADRMNAFA
jgi:DNA-binding MarR family transcriptional regulator